MSECDSGMRVTFYCHQHGSEWRSGHDRCLLARAEAAEAEVERLNAELADRNRRIEEALAFLHHPTEVNGCTCLAHQIAATLRGAP